MDLSGFKVCFLAGTLGQGGAERQLFYMLRALRRSGALPHLLCFSQNEFWEGRVKSLGVPITWVGQQKSRLRRLLRLVAELRRDRPLVFQSQHFYTSAYVGFVARLLRLPGIGALRTDAVGQVRANGRVGGWLILHAPSVVAANSQAALRYAVKYGVRPEQLYFLPNVVDTELMQPQSRIPEPSVRLITVGRLIPCKRFDRFLSALARLRRETKKPVKGLIVGAGPMRAQLEKQAGVLGLLPYAVEFRGSVADVTPLYQQADACVLTSDYEGTPNVLLEAMASALPVVATSVGGVPEIVQEGKNGFLVKPGDEDGLCGALGRLISDSEGRLEMGKAARKYVELNHSIDRLPSVLGSLYDLALS